MANPTKINEAKPKRIHREIGIPWKGHFFGSSCFDFILLLG